jgi:TonB family protein
MNKIIQHIILFILPKECNGINNSLSNQLIYSQLKNRLIRMTQKPSSFVAKWKYSGALPLILLAFLVFSFRPKESSSSFLSDRAREMPALVKDDNTEQPIFPGCEKLNLMEIADCSHKKLFEYVAEHLTYPESMKAARIEGKVYVTFAITTNGYVAEVRITKSLNPSADQAALDVVNSLNENVGKWTPGTKEGIPVTMDMVLPISFVLGTEKTTQETSALELNNDDPYTYVERMPTFPDGHEAMYKFIYDNIHYPETAKKKGISGQVIVQFVVSKEGEIQNAKVLRGIGGGCDEEALRVVNSMPDWTPGQHNGKYVPVVFTLPVKFIL